jgi:hypothetical protein
MNELEKQLQDALDATAAQVQVSEHAWLRNEQLLHELPRRRSRTTWMILAAAACVVGVLVAVAVIALPGGSKTPPAQPAPAPSPTATPTHPAPTRSAGPSAVVPPASTPPANVVSVGGARLTLPEGWVAEAVVPASTHSQLIMPTWCLMPESGPSPGSEDATTCAISISAAPTGSSTPQLSVDTPGGLVSNPEYCDPGHSQTKVLLDYSDTALGTRPADYRRWLFICADGTQWPVEQYVADNAPGFVLYSAHATAQVHEIMAEIAKTAQLPPISSPLRLSDFGIARSVTKTGSSYHVLVDRVVQGIPDLINNNPQTYAYDVPASAILGKAPTVGSLVELTTNGVDVTWFFTHR